MAVMTLSEARAALPEVVNRVAQGEEITITRYGRPMAVVVRPDVVWSQPGAEVVLDEADWLITDPARAGSQARGVARAGDVRAAGGGRGRPADTALPPIRLTTVRGTSTSTWSREEIYGDEGR